MKHYLITEIPPDSFFTKPVHLDPSFVLAAPEMPFSEELAKSIVDWGFKEVYSEGEPLKDYVLDGEIHEEGEIADLSTMNDVDKIQHAEEFYISFQKYVETLFTRITIKNELDFKSVAERVKNAVDFVREDRRFLMRAQKKSEAPADQNYLASHAVRSTIIAIIIGTYLKLPAHRLIELGVAALLHEIGMLKVPSQTYLSNRPLSPQERKAILGHPVLSFNMLKSYDFPLVVSLAALEHHERENGSGYPQHINGEKISLYAKIIAVACSYEALSSKRPHKEAKDGYTGMLELLKNEGKQYDDTVVRALVFSLSIYPIGLYVLLSSGKKGQVVDVNPENPRYPIVQVFGEFTPDGKNKIMETSPEGLSIVRPLTREEINA
ncbi:phosphohydrolase [Spirochaetia bacterium]|nr:phosphohydrolase [Spirochaetia bacterium]